ncbi:MAG TPA: general stress protein [Ktedonobacteraceae bacterium]|nr:general stress protein [Ktedonobacteraceae bacterium]
MQKHSTVVGVFDNHTAAVDAIKDLRQNGFSDDQIGFVVRHDDGANTDDTTRQGATSVARGVVGGLLGAADMLLLPVTGPADASTMLEAVLPATEDAIDNVGRPDAQPIQPAPASTDVPLTAPSETTVQAQRDEPTANDEPGFLEERGTSIITGSVIGGTLGAVAAMLIPGIGPILAGGLLAATFGGAAIGGIAGGFLSIGMPEQRARYYEQQFQAGHIILTVKAGDRQQQALETLHHYGAIDVEAH